jgi:hypothetical protein
VYLVGPIAGAAIAVGIAWMLLRGHGGDVGARADARGTLSRVRHVREEK